MSQIFVAAMLISELLIFTARRVAAETKNEAPEKKSGVALERTPDGLAYAIMTPPAPGPAPTLLLFANTGEATLTTEPYRRIGALVHAQGWNVVSLDLPCHGAELRKGEPAELAGWAARVARGEDIAADLSSRANKVLEHLIKTKLADPERLAAAGTSRGGFMAFQAALSNPRIRAVAGFAPVTDLLALSEFNNLKDSALAQRLALAKSADQLADRAAWIMIGNQDQRVGTDRAQAFAKALSDAAEKKSAKARVELLVVPVPGHASNADWHDQAAAWLLAAMQKAK